MIEYLTAKPLTLPHSLDHFEATQAGEGTLSTNLRAGVVFLENKQHEAFRLSWTAGESAEGRARSLPAGEYRLRTYRVIQKQGDQLWHLSATAPKIQRVTVSAGKNVKLEIRSGIRITSKSHGKRAMMGITGQKGAGLSIYKDGARIPIAYRFVDAGGEQVASGPMNYG